MRLGTTAIIAMLILTQPTSLWAQAAELDLDLTGAIGMALESNRDWILTQEEMGVLEQRREYDAKTIPVISVSGTALDYAAGDLRSPSLQLQGRLDVTDNSRLELTIPVRMVDDSIQIRPGISYTQDLFVPRQVERPVQPSSETEQILFSARQRLILDVGTAYYQVLRSVHELTLKKQDLHLAELQAQRVRELERPDVEALRADGEVDDARTALLRAEDALKDAALQFNDLLHADIPPEALDAVVAFQPLTGDLAWWHGQGVHQHSQVLEAQYRLGLAEANAADFAADHGYAVALTSSYQERTTAGQTDYELRAAVTVRKTLYPVDPVRSDELNLAVAKADLALEQAIMRAQREIETAYRQVKTIEDRIATLGERLDDARTSWSQEVLRYQAGLSTQLHVLELEYLVDTLSFDLLHAHYDHALAVAKLNFACSLVIPW